MGNRLGGVVPPFVALLDALQYAVGVTVVATVGAFVLSVTTGGGAVRANILLFVLGWLVMAYATVRLWPSKDNGDDPGSETRPSLPETHEGRLQGLIRQVPPIRWISLPSPEDRLSVRVQLFIASVCMLLTSFLLEILFIAG